MDCRGVDSRGSGKRLPETRLAWSLNGHLSFRNDGHDGRLTRTIPGKQSLNPVQGSVTALPAQRDVDAGQAQHHGLGGFRFPRRRCRLLERRPADAPPDSLAAG